jgi:hypothetical protein
VQCAVRVAPGTALAPVEDECHDDAPLHHPRPGQGCPMSLATAGARQHQKRRALAHQCPSCRRHFALRLVDRHGDAPSSEALSEGLSIRCRFCGADGPVVPQPRSPER